LDLHCYAVSTHPDEVVLEPPPKKNPGSAYAIESWSTMRCSQPSSFSLAPRLVISWPIVEVIWFGRNL